MYMICFKSLWFYQKCCFSHFLPFLSTKGAMLALALFANLGTKIGFSVTVGPQDKENIDREIGRKISSKSSDKQKHLNLILR